MHEQIDGQPNGRTTRMRPGFSLTELFVVLVIILLIIAILLPSLARARELAKRQVCASNLKGLGMACKIYATNDRNQWPTPGFSESSAEKEGGFRYLATGRDAKAPVSVGYLREHATQPDREGPNPLGSTEAGVTRAFWMIYREGMAMPKQFICPSSRDVPDPTEDAAPFHDFVDKANISYGYRVPYGPRKTRLTEDSDPRLVVIADSSPFYLDPGPRFSWTPPKAAAPVRWDDDPAAWRSYNSGNHGGGGNGEGQNVLFLDGHVSFERTPLAGIERDNIYTVMGPGAGEDARTHGVLPHRFPGLTPPMGPFPGCGVFSADRGGHAATDSLIYP